MLERVNEMKEALNSIDDTFDEVKVTPDLWSGLDDLYQYWMDRTQHSDTALLANIAIAMLDIIHLRHQWKDHSVSRS